MKFSAVILAGGRSTRMGSDKAWLPLGEKPLLARQIELVRELGAEQVFISGRADTDYGAQNCPVLKDRFENAGPLAGIERALAEISTTLLLVLAVDMPKMNLFSLQMLIAQCTENCGGVPRVNHRIEPLAAVYPRSALATATMLLENRRYAVGEFAKQCVELSLAAFIDLPLQYLSHFENWNTPADISDS